MKTAPRRIALFTRRLADLTTGGLTIHRSLDVLGRQSRDPAEAALVRAIKAELLAGKSFSQALSRQNGYFQPVYIGLVRAGESSGGIEPALEELARLLENEIEARQRVRAALAYPAVLLFLAIAVCVFLTVFVVPRFEFLFQDLGQRLPLPTRALIGFTLFVKKTGGMVALVLLGAGAWTAKKIPNWKQTAQRALMKLPVIRDFVRDTNLERWARVMASLLRSGFTVADALRLSKQTLAHPDIADAIASALKNIRAGHGFADSLSESKLFPPLLCELVAAAEESGRLEQTFERLAQTYRRESELHMKTALSFLEPALILVMGFVVGFVALAMLLPIFEMSASIR